MNKHIAALPVVADNSGILIGVFRTSDVNKLLKKRWISTSGPNLNLKYLDLSMADFFAKEAVKYSSAATSTDIDGCLRGWLTKNDICYPEDTLDDVICKLTSDEDVHRCFIVDDEMQVIGDITSRDVLQFLRRMFPLVDDPLAGKRARVERKKWLPRVLKAHQRTISMSGASNHTAANGSKSSRVVSLRAISEKGVYRGSSSECESTDDDDDEEEEELPGDRFLRAPTPHPECPDDVERVVSSFSGWWIENKARSDGDYHDTISKLCGTSWIARKTAKMATSRRLITISRDESSGNITWTQKTQFSKIKITKSVEIDDCICVNKHPFDGGSQVRVRNYVDVTIPAYCSRVVFT